MMEKKKKKKMMPVLKFTGIASYTLSFAALLLLLLFFIIFLFCFFLPFLHATKESAFKLSSSDDKK